MFFPFPLFVHFFSFSRKEASRQLAKSQGEFYQGEFISASLST